MTDLELNLTRFCVLFFCSVVFFSRSWTFRGRPNTLLGIRLIHIFIGIGALFAAVGLFCLLEAALDYFGKA